MAAEERLPLDGISDHYREAMEHMGGVIMENAAKVLAIAQENGANAYVLDDGKTRVQMFSSPIHGMDSDNGVAALNQMYTQVYHLMELEGPRAALEALLASVAMQVHTEALKRVAGDIADDVIAHMVEAPFQDRPDFG